MDQKELAFETRMKQYADYVFLAKDAFDDIEYAFDRDKSARQYSLKRLAASYSGQASPEWIE